MEALERNSQLSKFSQSLDLSGLAGYFDNRQIEATVFAPTDDAINKAAWEDWTADDQRLLGTLLYHTVPFKAEVTDVPRELPTNLGPDEIVLLRPSGEPGRLNKPQALAVVAPITDFHSPPARVLKTLRTCQGIVHIVDTALEPDDSSMEPEALEAAIAKLDDTLRAKSAEAATDAASSPKRRGQRGAQQDVLGQALSATRAAAAHRRKEDEEQQQQAVVDEEMRARQEQEAADLAEQSSPGGAARAVTAAQVAQEKALTAARAAFREAEASGQSLAALKAQDWLGAAEYAVEGMSAAKEAASWSGTNEGLAEQARAAAHAAMLLAEVSLAQHTAVAMARTGDWASALLGGSQWTVLGTESGKAWADAALDAHSAALKAASAAGALATTIASKAKAQDVLGAKTPKQPSDPLTLEAIRNLAQKLSPTERISLNSLLSAALKSRGGDSSSGVESNNAGASKVKKALKPEGSWPAGRREAQEEEELLEEKVQLQQDIAELSGKTTGSSFDAEPKKQLPRNTATKVLVKAASKQKLTRPASTTGTAQQMPATEKEVDDYDNEANLEENDSAALGLDAKEDSEAEDENKRELDAFVDEAVANHLRVRGKLAGKKDASTSGPGTAAETDGFFAEAESSEPQPGDTSGTARQSRSGPARGGAAADNGADATALDSDERAREDDAEASDAADRILVHRRANANKGELLDTWGEKHKEAEQ